MEVNQDLFTKMSKKIAQLTKIIYKFHTQIENHQESIESLTESHKEEVESIQLETSEKIKQNTKNEIQLKQRIQSLEESLKLEADRKKIVLAEFENYKQRREDLERDTSAQHAKQVESMSLEMEEIRRTFEVKLCSFSLVQKQLEQDEEKLQASHRQKMQELNKNHKAEVDFLSEQVQKHEQDKKRVADEYGEKLLKARTEYESELIRIQKTSDNLLALKQKDVKAQNADLQKTLDELRLELSQLSEKQRNEEDKSNKLQNLLNEATIRLKETCQNNSQEATILNMTFKHSQLKDMELHLKESKAALTQAQALNEKQKQQVESLEKALGEERALHKDNGERLQTQENEVNIMRDNMAKTLQKAFNQYNVSLKKLENEKSQLLAELKASRNQIKTQAEEFKNSASLKKSEAEQEINQLLAELKATRDQVKTLEKISKKNSVTLKNTEKKKNQLLAELEAIRDKVKTLEETSEKNSVRLKNTEKKKDQLLVELEAARNQAKTLEETSKKCSVSLRWAKKENARMKAELNATMTQVKVLLEESKKNNLSLKNLEEEKIQLQTELEQKFQQKQVLQEEQTKLLLRQLQEVTTQLTVANAEVSDLEIQVHQSKQTLSVAEQQLSTLKETHSKQLEKLKAETSNQLESLKKEVSKLESQKEDYKIKHKKAKQSHKLKIENIERKRQLEWAGTLRQKCEEHEKDKTSALDHLAQTKDMELSTAQESWICKEQNLVGQIAQLQDTLEKLLPLSKSLQQQNAQFTQDREHLLLQLQENHSIALQKQEEIHQKNLKEMEHELCHQHQAEIKSLQETHLQSLKKLKEQSELELQSVAFQSENNDKSTINAMRTQLNLYHASAIKKMKQAHQQELSKVNMKVEESLLKKTEMLDRISELEKEVSNIHPLHENIRCLTKEVELQGQQVLQTRREANQQIFLREQEMVKRNEEELSKLRVVHTEEIQNMSSNFKKVQKGLEDKVSALKNLLTAAEDKYKNRKSRPEDQLIIANLKSEITNLKRYKSEMDNREKNFRIFKGSPISGPKPCSHKP